MLEGRRCRLRPFRPDDAGPLRASIDDPDVVRWMSHEIPHPYTAADARWWLEGPAARRPVDHVVVEVDGAFAGGAGLRPDLRGEFTGCAEIGYWLAAPFRGRGVATEVARLLSAHALRERGFRRLGAWVFAPNVASQRVLAKAGYRHEGTLRAAVRTRDGAVADALLFGRLASDPEPGP